MYGAIIFFEDTKRADFTHSQNRKNDRKRQKPTPRLKRIFLLCSFTLCLPFRPRGSSSRREGGLPRSRRLAVGGFFWIAPPSAVPLSASVERADYSPCKVQEEQKNLSHRLPIQSCPDDGVKRSLAVHSHRWLAVVVLRATARPPRVASSWCNRQNPAQFFQAWARATPLLFCGGEQTKTEPRAMTAKKIPYLSSCTT